MTKQEFEVKANIKHNNKYDYSSVVYINNKTKVDIKCPVHGIFKQVAGEHLRGSGCPRCGFEKSSSLRNKIASDNFIEKVTKIHNNKYNYDLVEYVKNSLKVKIICPVHDVFEQTPAQHLKGHGCLKCSNDDKFKTTEEFIEVAKIAHKNRYDYSETVYVSAKKKLNIVCKKHGIFQQRPNDHLSGAGCPVCRSSRGETKIIDYLNDNKINYIHQKKFDDCYGDSNRLVFDFYLQELNICVEYDGEQHYKSKECFGGIEALKITQKYDQIKTQYCIDNNINLIRIKYNENVEKKLNEYLKFSQTAIP